MSRHSYADADAKCPYYMEQGPCYIKCEGIREQGSITLTFMTKGDKERWVSEYCNRYPKCQFCAVFRMKALDDL